MQQPAVTPAFALAGLCSLCGVGFYRGLDGFSNSSGQTCWAALRIPSTRLPPYCLLGGWPGKPPACKDTCWCMCLGERTDPTCTLYTPELRGCSSHKPLNLIPEIPIVSTKRGRRCYAVITTLVQSQESATSCRATQMMTSIED